MASPATPVLDGRPLIGSELLDTAAGGVREHRSQVTGQPLAPVVLAGAAEVDRAVRAANEAFPEWSRRRASERRRTLQRFAQLLADHRESLARIILNDGGTPIAHARIHPVTACEWLEVAAGWADKLDGEVFGDAPVGTLQYTRLEPIGVVGAILTWNAPVPGLGMAVGPALAAGCTVVVKPSELAPFAAIAVGKLALEAGLPPGVLNIVVGTAEAGAALVSHPQVAKISFVGGPDTGRVIAAACGEQLKPVTLELGGKSANIVFEDACLTRAARQATSIIGNAGQVCTAPSRLLIQRPVYDRVLAEITIALAATCVGDPNDPATTMGPLITEEAVERVLSRVRAGVEQGSTLVCGGKRLGGELAAGFFMAPTLLRDVDPAGALARQELFGPVVAAMPFDTEEEAIAIANATDYGLAAYVHTRDLSRAHRVAAALRSGSVGINGHRVPLGAHVPYGGVKESGYGHQGGRAGLLEFVVPKAIGIEL